MPDFTPNPSSVTDPFCAAPTPADALSSSRKRQEHPLPAERSLLGRLLLCIGRSLSRFCLDVDYQGLEHLPSHGNFILTPNHQSYLDGMWVLNGLSAETRRHTCVMVGADLKSDYGLLGKILHASARPIPVERKGNPVRSLIVAKNVLLAGENVLIHPEGTRCQDGRLAQLHNGASWMAKKCRVPLVPVYLEGAYAIWPRQRKYPSFRHPESGKKRRLVVHFLPPLDPSLYPAQEDLTAALTEVLQAVEKQAAAREGER